MADTARVDSVDALKDFKRALWKFAETASVALSDAESEMQRAQVWLETEQFTYWTGQLRKRLETVTRCKEAVRQKKLFKNAVGGRDSVVDEEKAISIAVKRQEEAEQKLRNCKMYNRKLQKEIEMYKGAAQRLSTTVHVDIPAAAAKLENMVAALGAYISVKPSEAASAAMAGAEAGMSRAAEELKKPEGLPALTGPQVAVAFANGTSGELLGVDGKPFAGEGERYVVANSVDAARELAYSRIGGGDIQCTVYDSSGNVVEIIRKVVESPAGGADQTK